MAELRCSFCGKSKEAVKKLIAGPNVHICDECTKMCSGILAEEANASIKIHFHAHQVFIVMGSTTGQPIPVKLLLNGKAIPKGDQGADVVKSAIKVSNQTLYRILALGNADSGELEVISSAPGLKLYTFTFGE